MKLNNKGFGFLEFIILVVVVAGVGVLGWFGYNFVKNNQSGETIWRAGESSWSSKGAKAPECGSGPAFDMPVDLDKVTAVLYPGQKRGNDYKPHGGFIFENSEQNEIDVRAPIDSHLIKASRYIESGEIQYFMVFSVPCGFAYRFDHLLTLTPEFQEIMNQLPEARENSSQTTDIDPAFKVTKGRKIATGVGVKFNTFVDFGIYDVRKPNQNSSSNDSEFGNYGVCFFDYLDSASSSTLKALPGGDGSAGKTSDYCS